MTRQPYALAICRVSSVEQLENNSLNRQREKILKAAEENDLHIPADGWWSGSVSSKKGSNINRKDLSEILERCKKEKRIKYLIVDEVDRFMRSMLEMGHFLVKFKELGVKVIFASQPNLKTDTATDTLLLMLEAFKAEGSNEERQHKSIDGNAKLLREGKYPFPPKPGYMRGKEKSMPEVHPIRGRALQRVMVRIATRQVTPSQGLIELNNSEFMKDGHSHYKMDKFRAILIEPFYAGVIHIDKQIKVYNENGLHEPLITKEQHIELVKIMDGKKKNQGGPRKNGNPEYPLSNHVTCQLCVDKSTTPRYVGFPHGNGKNLNLIYHKYRCRGCNRYITRAELHEMIIKLFRPISDKTRELFIDALNTVWKEREGQAIHDADRIKRKITLLEQTIAHHVDAYTNPESALIKDSILAQITKKQQEITDCEAELGELKTIADEDKERFLRFAFDFINDVGKGFLDYNLPKEYRVRCKLILFPAGFYLDAENKVYTPQISPIYGLTSTKKDLPDPEKSLLVRVQGL